MSRKIVGVLALLSSFAFFPTSALGAPPAGWAKLQDIPVFTGGENPTGWAGGDGLEVANGYQLPIDTAVTADGAPSLRIQVTNDPSWWWTAMLVWRSWGTANLEPYFAHGALELDVLGAVGGEDLTITIQDRGYERYVDGALTETVGTAVPLSRFATVTTAWQHVVIPLSALIDPTTFRLREAWYLRLSNAGSTPMLAWVANLRFTSPDDEPSFPAIKVNQVGYLPLTEKKALVTGFDGVLTATAGTPFTVKRASDGRVFLRGKLTQRADFEPSTSGERVLQADFSSLVVPGTYVLSVNAPGVADSAPFRIAPDVYAPLLRDAARYYYLQRANLELDEAHAGAFARADMTPIDFAAPFQSNPSVTRDVSGGWYDAGDFGKYVSAGATSISDLLWAYELVPWIFDDGQLDIPESGNGRPDLLDEVKVETDFLLKMQDTDGGFFSRIYQTDPRQISDVVGGVGGVKPTAHSASATAALAHAAIVFRRWDPAYAATLLAAARHGWDYLEQHPEMIATPGGPYADWADQDDRFWAAATLFRATGEGRYDAFVLANYQAFQNDLEHPENAHGVGSMQLIGYLQYLRAARPDRAVVTWFKREFKTWAAVQIDRMKSDPWRNTLHDNYYWGSNGAALATSTFIVAGSALLRDVNPDVMRVMQANLDYVLGVNPLAWSYVSGYGARSTAHVFSGIYSFDGKPGIPPGYLSGGANQYEGAWFSRFHGKCFNDVDTEWTTNEHTIYWNSGLVFSAAVMSAASALGN